ncbi:hypothetical protein A4G19_02950 [Pasteurellaceae bacterium Macca]|nr:hypothetical protein [Pasteurellaceae bacterium Macca]
MKKFIIVLTSLVCSMNVIAAQKSITVKLTDFTKSELRKIEKEMDEGSGDNMPISTSKGTFWFYIEAQATNVLREMPIGNCVKITAQSDEIARKYIHSGKAVKVKCPKN